MSQLSDWLKKSPAISGILQSVAPTVATALGGPFAGMAVKALTDGLGTTDPDTTMEAIASADPTILVKLREIEQQVKKQAADLEIDLEKVAAADRDSARQREIQTGDHTTPQVLAAIAVLGFFAILGGVLWKGIPDGAGGNVLMLLIGTLTGIVMAVYNYYFGSSKGSSDKTKMLMNGGTKH